MSDFEATIEMVEAAAKLERKRVVQYLRNVAGHGGEVDAEALALLIESGAHLRDEAREPGKAVASTPAAKPSWPVPLRTKSESQARSGLNKHMEHAFVRAVLAGWPTVKEWAKVRGYSYQAVHSWYTESESGGRRIPDAAAEAIAKEFPSCPANEETWPNGIQRRRFRAGPSRVKRET